MQQNISGSQKSSVNPLLLRQVQDCIKDCIDCHHICSDRAMSALDKEGRNSHIKSLLDSAEISLATAHSMMRNSDLQGYFCNACASICNHCAKLCEKVGDKDCANACRAAANSCQQIVKMVA